MVKSKRFILKKPFEGVPKLDNFELVEEDLPELKNGEIQVEALYLSVDPYMRVFTTGATNTVIGQTVCKVVESKDEKFPVGSTVLCNSGWMTQGIFNPSEMNAQDPMAVMSNPNIGDLPLSHLLGACGMPGNTAYFGFLEICNPKPGETVLVNGAGGAVGSFVGQIAKIKGCKVLGLTGSDEKCEFLVSSLGFDRAFNYKKGNLVEWLQDVAPKGVDCFFDNVGGLQASLIINSMNSFGRVAICGHISTYNEQDPPLVPAISHSILMKQLKIEGFHAWRWTDQWNEGILQMATWIQEGKIQAHETVVEGFEKMPEAFIGLFSGANLGKMIVKA